MAVPATESTLRVLSADDPSVDAATLPSEGTSRVRVGVFPDSEYQRNRRLLTALESLFPVSFSAGPLGADACLFLAGGREAARPFAERGIACYAVATPDGSSSEPDEETWIELGRSAALVPCFRSRRLWDPERHRPVTLHCEPGDEVLAKKGDRPIWVHQSSEHGWGFMDLVALAPPLLQPGQYLAEYLCRDSFARVLPLAHFLKRITARHRWQAAPRRACLVFDDPSLPSPTYGCLNFAKLAAHAREWRYHAAIATIPLSSRRVSAENAALFRASAQLSLVIHGNDHVAEEMTRQYSERERVALVAQAWRRIAEMERQHEISVGRVMEAPYGVIDQAMIDPLVRMGYEATLITPTQFLRHNRAMSFDPAIGLRVAEHLPGGLSLLPRIRLAPHWQTEVLIAALLDQPIIVVGHHYDAANDMVLMEEIAQMINDLPSAQWTDLVSIARSQYEAQRQNDILRVRLGSRRVVLPIPEGVRTVLVERPWMMPGQQEQLHTSDSTQSTATADARTIEILATVANPIDPAQVPPRGFRLWPLVRRVLMEARDRTYPYFSNLESPTRATSIPPLVTRE